MGSVREIQALNKRELENCVPPSASWHTDYRDTAYIYIGGLSFELTEGDIITIFSQFGEPVWLKLVRDKETGKSKGFAFLKYEDQRSTDLAVDNLGGATVLGRTLRVDHTRYKKRDDENDDEFDVSVRVPEHLTEVVEKRHRHRHHHRNHGEDHSKQHRKSRRIEDLNPNQHEHDEEDPMKDYLAREKAERSERRRSRERRHEGDKHRESRRTHDKS